MIAAHDWLAVLRARVEATSITQVAVELAYSRTALSLVLGGKYPASTERLAERTLATYDRHACPHLQREIAGHECRTFASKPFSPSSPMQARHWRACQGCALNPTVKRSAQPAGVRPPPPKKGARS